MRVVATALFLTALAFCTASAAESVEECTITRDGTKYDLSGLRATKDYEISSPYQPDLKVKLNVCGAVKTELWHVRAPAKDESVGAYYRGKDGDVSIGSVNTTLDLVGGSSAADKGLLMLMTDGSTCKDGGRAATAIQFLCDPRVGLGSPTIIAHLPLTEEPCTFFIEWHTAAACGGSAAGGILGLILMLLTLFVLAFVAYFASHICYNRFVMGRRGIDQLPTASVGDILSSVRDFFAPLFQRRQRGFGSGGPAHSGFRRGIPRSWQGGGGGYIGLPTDDEEASRPLNGGSGPASAFALEDDDDEIDERDRTGPGDVPSPARSASPVEMPVPVPNGSGGLGAGRSPPSAKGGAIRL